MSESPVPTATNVRPIQWHGDLLRLLDQRVLPHAQEYVDCHDADEVADAIRAMVVRGAPAIGISAAWGIVLAARAVAGSADWRERLEPAFATLAESRPTAVNLFWALDRMRAAVVDAADIDDLVREAEAYMAEDLAANHSIGRHGAALIAANSGVYTHCNTGSLATAGYGTALGVVRHAWGDHRLREVFAGETRPWLQGARLTAWELMADDIPVQLCCDAAAGQLLASGRVHWVVVGADRITANGDTANKIGTYNLAVLARHHGVRFMVAAHTSTIDPATASGDSIHIEERPPEEVTTLRGLAIAPAGCRAINPAFDITPASLIDALVTERGVIETPDAKAIAAHLA